MGVMYCFAVKLIAGGHLRVPMSPENSVVHTWRTMPDEGIVRPRRDAADQRLQRCQTPMHITDEDIA